MQNICRNVKLELCPMLTANSVSNPVSGPKEAHGGAAAAAAMGPPRGIRQG
jgi:hypothetical protein